MSQVSVGRTNYDQNNTFPIRFTPPRLLFYFWSKIRDLSNRNIHLSNENRRLEEENRLLKEENRLLNSRNNPRRCRGINSRGYRCENTNFGVSANGGYCHHHKEEYTGIPYKKIS